MVRNILYTICILFWIAVIARYVCMEIKFKTEKDVISDIVTRIVCACFVYGSQILFLVVSYQDNNKWLLLISILFLMGSLLLNFLRSRYIKVSYLIMILVIAMNVSLMFL